MGGSSDAALEYEQALYDCLGNWRLGIIQIKIIEVKSQRRSFFEAWIKKEDDDVDFIMARIENTDELNTYALCLFRAGYRKLSSVKVN